MIQLKESYSNNLVKNNCEKNPDIFPEDVLMFGFQKVVVECKIPGITCRNLRDADYGTKKYNEAIVILKDDRMLTETKFGKTSVLFPTDLIEYAAERVELEEAKK